jgi:phosphoribosylglycinamide formyltransferase 1
MRRLGIVVSGSGSNMQAIVEACRSDVLGKLAEPALVLSNRPGAGALDRARLLGVPAECVPHARFPGRPEHETALLEALARHRVDLVVLAGYMRILTSAFLRGAPGPVLNIHPVPTHLYQGAAGYEALWERRAELRAAFPTIHFVDAGVDTGRVLLYGLPYGVADAASLDELRARGLTEEHAAYPEAIRYLLTTPQLEQGELEVSAVAMTGISQLETDLLSVSSAAAGHPGARLLCLARRDWQGTGYHLRVEDVDAPERTGWLAGLERACFTRLLLQMLRLAKHVPCELVYEGLPIELNDTRKPPDAG